MGPPHLQVDRLIETARKWNLPPVFAFYNHLDDTFRLSTTACGTLNMMQYPFPESWGVCLVSAPLVRNAMPTNTFDYHHRISRPFHCLFCSRSTGTQDVDGIAGTAAAALSSLFEESGSDDALDPELLPPFQPEKTVPELFRRAEIMTVTRLDDESPGLSDLQMDYPEIAGAVIVRDVPSPMRSGNVVFARSSQQPTVLDHCSTAQPVRSATEPPFDRTSANTRKINAFLMVFMCLVLVLKVGTRALGTINLCDAPQY